MINTLCDHIKWTRRKKSESIHHFSSKNMRVKDIEVARNEFGGNPKEQE